ncbi:beta-galactosidase [Paenibacillus sp. GCM10027626]|uniref:beta-galactosidase n=1 Tax=Paenibacillus sp. GCM10027626 TaxID=3273411 RepID=UPI0036421644
MSRRFLASFSVIIVLVVLAAMFFYKDKNNEGQTEFPIGLWVTPPVEQITLERYREIKDAGITFITGFREWEGGEEAIRRSLDYAEANDLKVLVRDPRLNKLGMDQLDQMKGMVTLYANHPAYMGHVFYDEPSSRDFERLAAMKQEYSKYAPNGLAYVNLFATYASLEQKGGTSTEYVQDYLRQFDPQVLSYDHYPFLTKAADDESAVITEDYFYNLELIRSEAVKHNIPFWLFIQTLSFNQTHRDPTEEELRWQVYTSLAYGAKGIQYFTYWTPEPSGGETFGEGIIDRAGKQTRHYGEVQRLNREVQAIGSKLMHLKSEGVIHYGAEPPLIAEPKKSFEPIVSIAGDPAIIGCFSDDNGRQSILAVNASFAQHAVTTLTVESSVKRISWWKNGEWGESKVENGEVKLDLAPGQGTWVDFEK